MFNIKRISYMTAYFLLAFSMPSAAAERKIIDLHIHAGPGSSESKLYTAKDGQSADDAQAEFLFSVLDENNVVLAALGGPPKHVERIRSMAPKRFIGSVIFPCGNGVDPNLFQCFEDGGEWPDLKWLEAEAKAGRIGAIGELLNVYAGVSPTDERMWPYYELAAKYDLLVLAHTDSAPPPHMRLPGCCDKLNETYGDPKYYRPVMERYPDLKLVLYHAFRPDYLPEAMKLMDKYPSIMVDTSPMSLLPTPLVHNALKTLVDAGYGERIVFGSDYWGGITKSVEVVESAPFLSEEQKNAIFYDNAAGYLDL